MTELGLLISLHTSGLVFALVLGSWLGRGLPLSAELHRLGGAIGRAAGVFLAQEFRVTALVVGVLAPIAFALYATLLSPGAGVGSLETGFWAAVALALGAANACLVARVATRVAVQASLSSLASAGQSLDRALVVAVRAGGSIGLFVETVSFIAISLVFGLLFAMKGGFSLASAEAISLGRAIALLLPAHALGAAAAALVIQRGGATYHTAGDLAADLAGERDAGLDHDDARNPAVIADLVGDHVGKAAGRATDLYVTATASTVIALLVGIGLLGGGDGRVTLALVAFPLIARAFGVVATGFGVMVVRSDDSLSPVSALWRGQLTTALISLAGLFGAAHWLIGDAGSARLFWAGASGLAAASVAAHLARLQIDRRVGPLRELLETQRTSESAGFAFGWGTGLSAAAWPLIALALAFTAAWFAGESSGLPSGGLLGTLTALMMMTASAPYLLALATFDPVADGARGVSSLVSPSEDAQRRATRLDETGLSASAASQAYLIVTGGVTAALAASALPVLLTKGARTVDLLSPAVAMSGALGLATVLAYAGSAARAGTRGARGVAQEVERQLRGFPRDKGRPQIPADYTPSYRSFVELTARAALHRLLPPIALGLAAPLALGVGLRLLFRAGDVTLPGQALAAFVIAAALTGMATALSGHSAKSVLSAARRGARSSGSARELDAALGGDAVADVLGNAAAPAAQLLTKSIAVVALVVAPFLSR
ncbi:MAG: sodium/proton-translocating pyrophosphatase [Myxococcales bacterium]|nr:sodium/proton-translocating pyrophosphatase [Myxococcales bacterium]